MRTLFLMITVVYGIVGLGLAYLYALLLAGRRPRHSKRGALSGRLRFAIAVPAHNEETVIGDRVTRMLEMEYPRDRFDVHVVADHCSDSAAEFADAVAELQREPELRQWMARNSRREAERRPWAAIMAQLELYYSEAVEINSRSNSFTRPPRSPRWNFQLPMNS